MRLTPHRLLAGVCVLASAAFAFALFSQHVLGMQPCAWCILQRMICLGIAVVAGAAWLARRAPGAATLGLIAVFMLALGGAIAAWYQHDVAAQLFSCDLTFADRVVTGSGLDQAMPMVFGVWATCADSAVDLLGVRYEIWTLILFILMAAGSVITLARPARHAAK